MFVNQSATEISTQNASNNMNQYSEKNEINMCDDYDDDYQIPNIAGPSIDKTILGILLRTAQK